MLSYLDFTQQSEEGTIQPISQMWALKLRAVNELSCPGSHQLHKFQEKIMYLKQFLSDSKVNFLSIVWHICMFLCSLQTRFISTVSFDF